MLNKVNNIDCIIGMKQLPDNCVDLTCCSPPYNVDIEYDIYKDNKTMDEYFNWTEKWLTEVYRTLKPDGRIALNVPIEINVKERGGRYFIASEFWQIMKKIGFNFFGMIDLEEDTPHRVKHTAWGSWVSPSSPYIYNPKECVILAYKEFPVKQTKGDSHWSYTIDNIINEDGKVKQKKIYSDEDKKEFMNLVFGRWKYVADKKTLTKATFSLDIPLKAIKILTYKGDLVMDCFGGSSTTALAAEILGNDWIEFEISENYCKIGEKRIQEYRDQFNQIEAF